MNRFFRRITRFRKGSAQQESAVRSAEAKRTAASTPQDVTSVRAKSQRHGKVTADKWNQ
jgi:hypothetical protein